MYRIYGHETVLNIFKNVISQNKISNAYLLVGEKGLGKRFMAEYFAIMVNCKKETEKPCFKCSSCLKLMDKNHPDVFFIEPEENSIKVDTIRYITNEINIRPYEANKKIFIIDQADKMTVSAQNAFLKTLEEPPLYGLFILIASQQQKLLPTIISRCNIVRFGKESKNTIKNYLICEQNIPEKEAEVLAHIADGNFDQANKLTDNEYLNFRKETIQEIEKILTIRGFEVIEEFEFFDKNKDNIEEILKIMLYYVRDLLIYKVTKDASFIKNIDFLNKIQQMESQLTINKLNNIINKIEQFNSQINSNVNYQLAVENLLLDMAGGL
ncbi:DNA polymerase III subunit delta' [Thermoanaerobacter pentosaceus]|uniref:DNA polymerase III subunit delta' n=1 Tax=Thermoanaerobacter pentosaceus TaxID=694059 RepID=A0ABT9M5V2_9THEO|nr:DNA polymerase III subunit delta' [Thermoanaerobacter pentosaceus]MDP9751512.1 DNA polymerase-3 subunit delta' [Thermoanaerobacter pentosaceus]